jgi:hypothetical protein
MLQANDRADQIDRSYPFIPRFLLVDAALSQVAILSNPSPHVVVG